MLERVDAGQGISNIMPGPPRGQGGPSRPHVLAEPDAAAELVRRINLTPPSQNPQAARRTRQRIAAGQPDTVENIREAARHMLRLGV
ncbi:MAG TPA: hypothetical protein ENN81_03695 [Phycisphaerales bacterium]|nr:hypothetical protein [Phycisphaerales bacterium]